MSWLSRDIDAVARTFAEKSILDDIRMFDLQRREALHDDEDELSCITDHLAARVYPIKYMIKDIGGNTSHVLLGTPVPALRSLFPTDEPIIVRDEVRGASTLLWKDIHPITCRTVIEDFTRRWVLQEMRRRNNNMYVRALLLGTAVFGAYAIYSRRKAIASVLTGAWTGACTAVFLLRRARIATAWNRKEEVQEVIRDAEEHTEAARGTPGSASPTVHEPTFVEVD